MNAGPKSTTAVTRRFEVDCARHGQRIDTFLTSVLRNYHAWRFARLVDCGRVEIDHRPADRDSRVMAGQVVSVRLADGPDKLLDPEPADLEFLFVDPWIAVLNKRPGVVVHPTGDHDSNTLCNHLQSWLDKQTACRGIARPGIVHRLDRETSGALAVAFEATAHRGLAESFGDSQVSKSYLAIVEGIVDADKFVVRRPIGRARSGNRVLMSCQGDALDRKPATTTVAVLRRFPQLKATLVRCVPRTGRHHQIRVHMASEGHPLLSDAFYRAGARFHSPDDRELSEYAGLPIKRHALHADRLSFLHPIGGGRVDVTAPIPADFGAALVVLSNGEKHSSEVVSPQ